MIKNIKTIAEAKAKCLNQKDGKQKYVVVEQWLKMFKKWFSPSGKEYTATLPAVEIYSYVAGFNEQGQECYANQKTLANIGMVSDRQVRNIINMFIDMGVLSVEARDGQTSLYKALPFTDAHITPPEDVKTSVNVEQLEAPIAIVDKIASVNNADNEKVEKLYAYVNGEYTSLFTEANNILVNEGAKLAAGDIIQFTTNAQGEIESISVLFSASKMSEEFTKTYGDNNEMTTVYGKVTKKFADSINVSVNGEADINYSTSKATVYNFDSSKSASNRITVATAADITKWEDEANEVRVFLRIYQDEVKEIVIVQ